MVVFGYLVAVVGVGKFDGADVVAGAVDDDFAGADFFGVDDVGADDFGWKWARRDDARDEGFDFGLR